LRRAMFSICQLWRLYRTEEAFSHWNSINYPLPTATLHCIVFLNWAVFARRSNIPYCS